MKPKSIMFAFMTIQEARQTLLFQLYHLYDDREAANITDWIMESLTGWKKIDRVINKNVRMSANQQSLLNNYITALASGKPVQYVLNESYFLGMKFFVDENVLIPRPETEELVEWICADLIPRTSTCTISDIGTGSGCIAIGIKSKLPAAEIYAIDVSKEALAVAEKNATELRQHVTLIPMNILDRNAWSEIPVLDVIVSNPPYITRNEQHLMAPNVTEFEPHVALFVENEDPFIFYQSLIEFGDCKLIEGGKMYVEINEKFGTELKELFSRNGYQTELRKDMQGKDRMIKAWKYRNE